MVVKRGTRVLTALLVAVMLLFCGHQLYFRAATEYADQACATAIQASELEKITDDSAGWMAVAGVDYIIREDRGYDLQGAPVFSLALPENVSLPLALVENHTRTGVNIDPLPSPEIPVVKTLYLYDDYADRMVGEDSGEIEDLLFRATVDRGMRLLILTPFSDKEGRVYTDPEVYAQCLSHLRERIERRGLTLDGTFSCMELDQRADLPLPVMPQKMLMLLSAVIFPCGAAFVVASTAKTNADRRSIRKFLLGLLSFTAAGAAAVSSFMTEPRYLLGADVFSGVKIALMIPMALGGLLLVWTLRHELLGHTGWKNRVLLLGVLVVACGVCMLLTARSGDRPGWTSELETTLRNWLEHTLFVRPRTKELLFSAPCIPVFLWACWRKLPELKLLCGLGVCLECVSVVNTFCHGVAPLYVSIVRSLLGLGLGCVLGGVICLFLYLLDRKRKLRLTHQ